MLHSPLIFRSSRALQASIYARAANPAAEFPERAKKPAPAPVRCLYGILPECPPVILDRVRRGRISQQFPKNPGQSING